MVVEQILILTTAKRDKQKSEVRSTHIYMKGEKLQNICHSGLLVMGARYLRTQRGEDAPEAI